MRGLGSLLRVMRLGARVRVSVRVMMLGARIGYRIIRGSALVCALINHMR